MIFIIATIAIVSWVIGAIMGYQVGSQPIIEYVKCDCSDDGPKDDEMDGMDPMSNTK